jgi:hypothetical protein
LGGQARVFCHRFGDSGIEATIERMKSSVVIGAFCLTANSVTAWHMSP